MTGHILANKSITNDRRFDCLPEFDTRSRMFLSRQQVRPSRKVKDKQHDVPIWLDQGPDGMCVGFGFSHELVASPVEVKGINYEFAKALYKYTQTQDPWPGENYSGTSVLSGAKVCKELGYITSYYWATSAKEVAQALSYLGPVVIGVNWHEGMAQTTSKGFIRVTGAVRGGHCVCLRGVKVSKQRDGSGFAILGRNSWGRQWGQNGDFWITEKDLQKLVDSGGSFCVPTGRADSGRQPPSRKARPFWRFWE